jgi:formyltetrahydrofolate deformylase
MINAILLISCPDQKGITAKITDFVFSNDGNIVHADQHIDEQTSTFFMRIEWQLDGFKIARQDINKSFQAIASQFSMDWSLYFSEDVPKLAIFVSKHTHLLYDLLLRHQEGQFACQIPVVISNHPYAQKIAESFNVKFFHFPKSDHNKAEVEKEEARILEQEGVELVVLARYMQIFSHDFIKKFSHRMLNIHHSFLPAFAGGNPYQQAYRRGVKIIGATSHYVTHDLDAGPIIEQDTVRVSHRDSLDDLKRKGKDLEKIVLSRAVRWYLERKILTYNNKTVIFD